MTAAFADHVGAEFAYASVAARGFTPADLRLHMSAATRERLLATAVQRRERDGAIAALVTALVSRPIPRDRVALYDVDVAAGVIVMAAAPRSAGEAAELAREWSAAGAMRIVCPLLDGRGAA